MIMQLQLDIRESWGNRPTKDQEEYEALAKCHGDTIQRTPGPKRGLTAWEISTIHIISLLTTA